MEPVSRTFIDIENIFVGKKADSGIELQYEMAKAMIPIYVFHRSQGCDEGDAYDKAEKEMKMILKKFLERHAKPAQQEISDSE